MQEYERFYVCCEPGIFGSCRGKLTLLAEFPGGFFSCCFYVVLGCSTETGHQSKVEILHMWRVNHF